MRVIPRQFSHALSGLGAQGLGLRFGVPLGIPLFDVSGDFLVELHELVEILANTHIHIHQNGDVMLRFCNWGPETMTFAFLSP